MNKVQLDELREAVDEAGEVGAHIRDWWPHPEIEGVAVVGVVDYDEGHHFPLTEVRCDERTGIEGASSKLARFLAAAQPELIEELLDQREELLDALQGLVDLYSAEEGCHYLQEWRAAREALKKAEGE